MHYKILFLDIDGTILRPDDSIEASTKEAVRKVKENGIEVFLATGRPLHEIRDIGEELGIESFIGYNGAYAVHKGNDVVREPMEVETIQYFLEVGKKHGHEAVMYTHNKNVFTSIDAPKVQEFIERFHLKHNDKLKEEYLHQILGVTVLNLEEGDPALYEEVGDLHLASVNLEGIKEHAYDVIRDKVNKGFAVGRVLELLEIDREQAIAFGDAMNDKEMLSLVGEGFAMGNAHPDLFAYAKHRTTEVTNSGVYNGLKSLGLV